MKIILAYITLLLTAFAAFGQTRTDTVKVYFRVGASRLDPSFSDNSVRLDSFDAMLREAIADGRVDSLVIRGYASPEGGSDANERLSVLRTQAVADYIASKAEIDPGLIRKYPEGVAWGELRSLVERNLEVPYRDEILNILDNVPLWIYGSEGKILDGRKKRLMELGGGEAWRWMLRNLFPELRNAVAVAVYFTPTSTEPADTVVEIAQEDVTHTLEELPILNDLNDLEGLNGVNDVNDLTDSIAPKSRKSGSFLMAVKTNMLYDAVLVPNLGVEFNLGGNVSIYGEWMYAWWDNNPKHRYWRIYGGDMGLRWWFGRKSREKRLSGHHLGIYGGILTFDFETGDYGYMGGKPGGTLWDRYLVNAGIEYGYSLPVAKRLNIDFSIGLGYLGGNYIKYYPFDNDYYYDKEFKMRFFGPTKAEISLVWLIGPGLTKSRKGGGNE